MFEEIQREIALIRSSPKTRYRILKTTQFMPKTQTDLQKELGIKLSNVNPEVKLLEENGLLKCLNPDMKKGKHYLLTKKGAKILSAIDDIKASVDKARHHRIELGERRRMAKFEREANRDKK